MIIGPGSILGGYLIERQLGSGGMGTVYLARHPALPRYDALKVLWPHLASDPEYRARFEREANLAAALDHPNIVAVQNKGEDQGCLWIALQYVPGTDAATAVDRDPTAMTPARALHIVTEVGKGLDHAHRAGLLHRDVKPANFLLADVSHGEERVLLADFGISKPSDDATQLTRTGAFVATVAYASPEQLSGNPVSPRSDIYSLGCSFYRLLTAQNPYPGTQPLTVMMGHINEPPPRITALRPDLPRALDDVLAQVLAKSPVDRYASCAQFTGALAQALSGHDVRRAVPAGNFAAPFADLAARRRDEGRAEDTIRNPRQSETVVNQPSIDQPSAPSGPHFGGFAAVGAVVLCLLIVGLVVFAVNRAGSADEHTSTTMPMGWPSSSAAIQSTTAVLSAGAARIQDPCRLLDQDDSTGATRFGLSQVSTATDLDDMRSCTWHPVNDGGVSGSILLALRAMPSASDAQSVRVGGSVDGLLIRAPIAGHPEYTTCAVVWPTTYGSARVEFSNYFSKVGPDELCRSAQDLADRVYPRIRR